MGGQPGRFDLQDRYAELSAGGDPQAWLADVLARISDLPQTRLDELLPWEWKRLRHTTATA